MGRAALRSVAVSSSATVPTCLGPFSLPVNPPPPQDKVVEEKNGWMEKFMRVSLGEGVTVAVWNRFGSFEAAPAVHRAAIVQAADDADMLRAELFLVQREAVSSWEAGCIRYTGCACADFRRFSNTARGAKLSLSLMRLNRI